MANNPIGAHVPGGKDLSKSLKIAEDLQLEAIQVFLSSPRAFKPPLSDPSLDANFKKLSKERGLRVFVHSSYILSFSTNKDHIRKLSSKLLKETIERAKIIGAEGVVLHAGSSGSDSLEEGYKRTKESLSPILEELSEDDPFVLLEPMAGQKNMLSSTIESIPEFFEKVSDRKKFGVCLDTAHLIAAGEPLDEDGGIAKVLERFSEIMDKDRLKLFHVNDSKFGRGSSLDRHENLGLGSVHENCWKEIFKYSGIDSPVILETPFEGVINDLEVLRNSRNL